MTRMNKWTPTTDLLTLRRMGKLLEELGEASNVAARVIIQGIDEVDPGSGKVNRERLENELADVQAQIGCTALAFDLDQDRMARRTAEKMRQMAEWEALFSPAGVAPAALSPICTYPACGGGCDDCPGPAPANGVPVAHPTDGERDLAALCVRLVRRLREVSPDDKLAATATDYLNQRRYLNPLRIKALEKAAPGVSVARDHTASPSPTDGGNK